MSGSGSKWTNSSSVNVGNSGTGKLSISDGGLATATGVSINSSSTLTTDLGYGSSLKVGSTGTGTITNSGTIRLVAGAGAAAGTYTPIAYGTLSGTGNVQALGGVWNSTNHTVTVGSVATTTAGTAANFDLSQTQRVLITDPISGNSVGAGFQAASVSTPITFGGSVVGGSELSALQGLLGSGQGVLSAWTFTTSGSISSSNPVYLSLFAGTGHSILNDVEVWENIGGTWSQFAANDLAYDGTYASFTATALEDFAVTGEVTPTPIPSALLLLGPGLAGLAFMRRRIFSA